MTRQIPIVLALWLTAAVLPVVAETRTTASETVEPRPLFSSPGLESGFRELYELRFSEARERFAAWQAEHPGDPVGEVSVAASYLFEEFYRQGVLSSEFFLNDKRLLGGIEGSPDQDRARAFLSANHCARELALERIKQDPHDPGALYALTLAAGMESNYSSILEKRNLESLHWIKQSDLYARELLMVEPDAQDAWLAVGAADYIIGSLPAHKRFFLRLGGIHGDRKSGLEELRRTSERGHYLKPYAMMLLGLAALREKQVEVARQQFTALAMEFPGNPLFTGELAKLDREPRPGSKAR